MTLSEILEQLDSFDEESIIYAKKNPSWAPSSEAVVGHMDEDGEPPAEAVGFDYLLEVYLAEEVLQVWSEWRDGRLPDASERCDAVIYYAKNDTYQPVG